MATTNVLALRQVGLGFELVGKGRRRALSVTLRLNGRRVTRKWPMVLLGRENIFLVGFQFGDWMEEEIRKVFPILTDANFRISPPIIDWPKPSGGSASPDPDLVFLDGWAKICQEALKTFFADAFYLGKWPLVRQRTLIPIELRLSVIGSFPERYQARLFLGERVTQCQSSLVRGAEIAATEFAIWLSQTFKREGLSDIKIRLVNGASVPARPLSASVLETFRRILAEYHPCS